MTSTAELLIQGGVKELKEIYSTNEICRADEMWGIIPIYINNGFSFFKRKLFADITCIHKRYTLYGLTFDTAESIKNYRHQVFYWEDGAIWRAYIENDIIRKEEFSYIHFMKRDNYHVNFDVNSVHKFLLTSNGFIPFSKQLSKKDIIHFGEYKGAIAEWWDIHKHDLKYWVIERRDIYFGKK